MARKQIVSVRPTQDGKWEVVKTTLTEDRRWQAEWSRWWRLVGEQLQAENPSWWAKHDIPTPA